MNNRRRFMISAGGGAAAVLGSLTAKGDQPTGSVYVYGMVWNQQLAAPMNDWLVRLVATAGISEGNAAPAAVSGFATLGDDFHDPVGSHVQLQGATLDEGNQLAITGTITESKSTNLVGQPVRISGTVAGAAVQGLTVSIGAAVFTGAGAVFIIRAKMNTA
jgi:hypothetical protein